MNPWIGGMPWASVGAPGVPAIGAVANYPALPASGWSGRPTAALPAYSFFTPSPPSAPTALDLNAILNQRDNALLYVNRFAPDCTKRVLVNSNTVAVAWAHGWGAIAGTYDTNIPHGNAPTQDIIAVVAAGDIIEVSCSLSMQCNGAAGIGQASIRLEYVEVSGAVTTAFAPATDQVCLPNAGAGTNAKVPITLLGSHPIVDGSGSFLIALNGYVVNATAAADWVPLIGTLQWRQWRNT